MKPDTLAPSATARSLFVSPSGSRSGAGTAPDPLARLTDAVARARELRADGVTGTITIHVAPGEYVVSRTPQNRVTESLPIVIDVSDVKILGATELALDQETNTPASALPGGSIFVAAQTLVGGEGMILLTPDAGGRAPRDVRISGLTLDGVGGGGVGIFVDRAQDFLIQGNLLTRFLAGLRTRGASGDLRGNLTSGSSSSGSGMVIAAGSRVSPAVVRITGNRASGAEIGILLTASGTNRLVSPGAAAITQAFDPAVDVATIPNRLTASVRDNVMSSNAIGLRVFAIGQAQGVYALLNSTRYETFASLDSRGNRYIENGYGVSLDAGFPVRNAALSYTSVFDAKFRDEVLSSNVTANAFFGFLRLQVATGVAKDPLSFEPLSRSKMTVEADGSLVEGQQVSHPATDSFDGTVLNNHLIVNGVEFPNR